MMMNAEPFPKVFLAESGRELAGFLEHCALTGLAPADFTIVSLEPEVRVLCREKGLSAVDTLPFFETSSQKRILAKSHELTTLIRQNLSIAIGPDVEAVLVDSFVYYSRFYINGFLWIIEVLKGIHEKYGTFGAFVCSREMRSGGGDCPASPQVLERDQFVAKLTAKYCRAHRLPVYVIEEERAAAGETGKRHGRKLHSAMMLLARTVFKLKLRKFSRFNTVFSTMPSYNLDRLCRDIQVRFPGTLAISDLPGAISTSGYLKLLLKALWEPVSGKVSTKGLPSIPVHLVHAGKASARAAGLAKMKEGYGTFASRFREAFHYGGCPFWEEYNGKVEADLLDAIAGIVAAAEGQREFLRCVRPKLVLSPVSTPCSQGWASVSGSLGIPALVIPQKMLLVPADEFARIEELYIGRAQVSDAFANAAAQSPLVTDYLKWSGYRGNIIETGNLIFARLDPQRRKKHRDAFFNEIAAPPGTKVVVWAPSMKTRRSRRFYVLESIDELISAMEDVFDAISRLDGTHLVFRIHPGEAITREEIYKLLPVPANVSVSDSGTFEDVLAVADLLLSFSSTAVQEALVNFIPVLLYDKWNRYNHLDAAGIEGPTPAKIAAAYYLHEKDRLSGSIRWILDRHRGEKVPRELFDDYVFADDRSPDFYDFVGRCLSPEE
jgi:hypothetical protein